MNRKAQLEAEVQVLGTLCNRAGAREQHADIVSAFDHYQFLEPEHQIIFGSIRSLLVRDRLSTTNLAVHLNNRGFPDVDLEKYCAAGLANIDAALKLARRLSSLTNGIAKDVDFDGEGS
ncbi:MAG: hypothetical protein JWN92_267 [Candidatus Acidoferrum typicum]|nr:hypothetical protein [Candidatus Acidoferrum typicum]